MSADADNDHDDDAPRGDADRQDSGGPSSAATTPDPAAGAGRPGPWGRLRRRLDRPPKTNRCMILGPTGSGKTLLLMSLQRCIDASSHSYARRYRLSIGDKNGDFLDKIDAAIEPAVRRGLRLDATRMEDCSHPQLTLHVLGSSPFRRSHDTRFETFDGAGELLDRKLVSQTRQAEDCRRRLEQGLEDCDSVLICLPIAQPIGNRQEQGIKDFIALLLRRQRIRELVVCLTMYETQGMALGRHAYRTLASRHTAREHMRQAFEHQLAGVGNALRHFNGSKDRRVWCVPVSTYGFLPRNGGPNTAIHNTHGRDDWTLRTLPMANDTPAEPSDPAAPYDLETVLGHLWRPFLTIDPFVFIATKDRRGTLIYHFDELDR